MVDITWDTNQSTKPGNKIVVHVVGRGRNEITVTEEDRTRQIITVRGTAEDEEEAEEWHGPQTPVFAILRYDGSGKMRFVPST